LISSAFPTKTNWRVSVGKYLAMIWLAFAKSSHQHFFEIVYKRFVKIYQNICVSKLACCSVVSYRGETVLYIILAEANDFSSIPFYATY
jgi:hypothetical protein